MSATMRKTMWVMWAAIGAACGPAGSIAPGKQAAAEALYAAAGPTKQSTSRSAGIDVKLTDLQVPCAEGGDAVLKNFTLKTDTTGPTVTVGAQYDAAYNNCGVAKTDLGVATVNGSFQLVQAVLAGTGQAKVSQTFKGRVTFDGALRDFLEADIVQSVDASSLGAGGGSVSVVLKGTLKDSSGTYTFDESVDVRAGNLSVQVAKH